MREERERVRERERAINRNNLETKIAFLSLRSVHSWTGIKLGEGVCVCYQAALLHKSDGAQL